MFFAKNLFFFAMFLYYPELFMGFKVKNQKCSGVGSMPLFLASTNQKCEFENTLYSAKLINSSTNADMKRFVVVPKNLTYWS